MNLLDTLKTIERLDQLIRLKATGSPLELSKRLETSERTIYNIIRTMKNMSAPIYYCKAVQSYCYEDEVRFKFGFYCKNGEAENLYGGFGKFSDFFSAFSLELQNTCSEVV